MGIAVEGVRVELHQLHQLAGAGMGGGPRLTIIGRPLNDRVADCAPRVERPVGVLENNLNSPAVAPHLAGRQPADGVIINVDFTAGGIDQPRDTPRHRRLAGAGLADDPQCLAAAHLNVHRLGRVHHPLAPQ